jgi:hypothetical protein
MNFANIANKPENFDLEALRAMILGKVNNGGGFMPITFKCMPNTMAEFLRGAGFEKVELDAGNVACVTHLGKSFEVTGNGYVSSLK